jgi:hypothetical protein
MFRSQASYLQFPNYASSLYLGESLPLKRESSNNGNGPEHRVVFW